jgi:hypothetical protein
MPAAISPPFYISCPCSWCTVTHRYSFHYRIDFIRMMTLMMIDTTRVRQTFRCFHSEECDVRINHSRRPVAYPVYIHITVVVFLDIINHPIFILNATFRRLDSVSVFRWNLLSLAQSVELVPLSGHLQCQNQSQSQSQSHFTTGGLPPISSSWRQAPWDSRPVYFFNWTLAVIILM